MPCSKNVRQKPFFVLKSLDYQDFLPTARATFNGIGGGCGGGGCGGAGGCSSGGDIGGWSGNNCYNIDCKQITKLSQAKNR